MAEIVYKKISDLDNGTVPLDGGELIMVSQTGVSKKATISQAHGAGWWSVLKVALSSFVAPEATHSGNADTLGSGYEEPSDFHDAAQLTGAIHLERIPEELTGKNSDTVDTYHAGVGDGKLTPRHGKYHGSRTQAQLFAMFDALIPNVGDYIPIHGGMVNNNDALYRIITSISRIEKTFSTAMTIYGSASYYNKSTNQWFTGQIDGYTVTNTGSQSIDVSIVY